MEIQLSFGGVEGERRRMEEFVRNWRESEKSLLIRVTSCCVLSACGLEVGLHFVLCLSWIFLLQLWCVAVAVLVVWPLLGCNFVFNFATVSVGFGLVRLMLLDWIMFVFSVYAGGSCIWLYVCLVAVMAFVNMALK
ncbi:uncharacterized protein LOC127084930 isoform X2 [Lathyrus oleraceus]|uniref:uncharacterized protein LOC127084930 isoform X2 n=1 Tax=Pisum sativum TaxID=3888 RepID=UPI0021D189E8|nr:uncharacterized protein LOC127084930 isoform X2 [Pisum sativum]